MDHCTFKPATNVTKKGVLNPSNSIANLKNKFKADSKLYQEKAVKISSKPAMKPNNKENQKPKYSPRNSTKNHSPASHISPKPTATSSKYPLRSKSPRQITEGLKPLCYIDIQINKRKAERMPIFKGIKW
jgi:hypothetical protein